MQAYIHQTAKNSMVIDSSWDRAQPWCNFVLFRPTWLPADLTEVANKLRPESSEQPASHRAEFKAANRSLSIKQFLYDWAPQAYDHPCLWRNAKISPLETTPTPKAHLIGNNYLWFGLDYRRKPAATINLNRTQIEITILGGVFNDDEIIQIVRGFRCVNPNTQECILATSFAQLAFDSRHQSSASAISVPTSYFRHTRPGHLKCSPFSAKDKKLNRSRMVGNWIIDIPITNYRLDSIFLFTDDLNQYREEEYYFESLLEPGIYIRFLVSKSDSDTGIIYPPQLSDQQCNYFVVHINDNELHHAWSKTNDNGCHSLVFKTHGCVVNCIVKPAPWTTIDWLRFLCAKTF